MFLWTCFHCSIGILLLEIQTIYTPANGNVIIIGALIAVLNTFHDCMYEEDTGLVVNRTLTSPPPPPLPVPQNSKHLSSYSPPCLPILHYFSPVNSSYLSCITLYIIFPSSLGVSHCIVVGVCWYGLFSWCFLHRPFAVDVLSIWSVAVQYGTSVEILL